jgi:hypothetical protein
LLVEGLNREEFMKVVVKNGERPKLDRNWPKGFSDLLTRCWDRDPAKRPSFAMIIMELNQLITAAGGPGDWTRRYSRQTVRQTSNRSSGGLDCSDGKNAHSTWF